MRGRLLQWLHIVIHALIVVRIQSIYVNISYVHNAVAKGAGNRKFSCIFRMISYTMCVNRRLICISCLCVMFQFVWMGVLRHIISIGDLVKGLTVG